MRGNEMRKFLDQTLAPLNDKVGMSLIAGIRTDIERVISGMRKEVRAAQEANEILVKDNEACRKETIGLRQEVRELKIELEARAQHVQNFAVKTKETVKVVDALTATVKELRDEFCQVVDIAKFKPEDVIAASTWLLKRQQLEIAQESYPAPTVCEFIKSNMISTAISLSSVKLMKWALLLTDIEMAEILLVGFHNGAFFDAVINKANRQPLDRDTRYSDRSAIFSNADNRIERNTVTMSPRTYYYAIKALGDISNVNNMWVARELIAGNLVVNDEFLLTVKGEGASKQWLLAKQEA